MQQPHTLHDLERYPTERFQRQNVEDNRELHPEKQYAQSGQQRQYTENQSDNMTTLKNVPIYEFNVSAAKERCVNCRRQYVTVTLNFKQMKQVRYIAPNRKMSLLFSTLQ